NWTAPLAWLSNWLDEHGQDPEHQPAGDGASGATNNGGAGGANAAGAAGANAAGATGSDPQLGGAHALDSSGSDAPGNAQSGCGCRMGTASDRGGGLLALGLALAAARRRRR
ncbi:MAG TPA: MYXO-CTERM sorting domain-containing protein, partial [Polyangiaceae bacterium]|nr:MYXO-CTERM sorting domain-containing protein [Polyangiaceae bacterium]